jgi:hypothetical protein
VGLQYVKSGKAKRGFFMPLAAMWSGGSEHSKIIYHLIHFNEKMTPTMHIPGKHSSDPD